MLANWTDQGIRNVKDSPDRAETFQKAVEQAGGRVEIYYTMGQYDSAVILEASDDAKAMEILLSIGRLGNVRTTTLKAFTVSEAREVIGKLA